VVVVAAALGLSGCGADLQPGAAATIQHDGVDDAGAVDTTIDEGAVDNLTAAFCDYVVEANKSVQQPQQLAVATLRADILNALIAFTLMGSLADSRGLTIRDSDVAAAAKTLNPSLPPELSDSDKELLGRVLDDSARATVEQSTLAANLSDSGQTSSEGVQPGAIAGSDGVKNRWFADADVDVNPAYGTWDGATVDGGSGSLSDLVSGSSPTAAPGDLPRTQVCG
jgi:hypothetical protein